MPGNILTLLIVAAQLVAQQSEEFKRWTGDECHEFIQQDASYQARDACMRVFGGQSEDVLTALIFRHSYCRIF